MNNVKISVIIPIYNTQDYIEKCIKSVLNQTLKEIEVILINDGSTDSSLEKIEKYEKDKRVMIINKKNEGVSVARNVGLEKATGEYIYFIDSDDYLENNNVFEELYNKCKDDDLDMIIFDYYLVYNNQNKKYIKNLNIEENIILINILDKKRIFIDLVEEKYWGVVWNKLVKREVFLKNSILFPENILLKEDLIITLELIYCSKKIGKINRAFYNYVQYESQSSKMVNKIERYENSYIVYKEIMKIIKTFKELSFLEKNLLDKRINLYYKVFRAKYRRKKIYKILKDEFLKNDKNKIWKTHFYKKMSLTKKVRFYFNIKLL